jgi:hypothetical protein
MAGTTTAQSRALEAEIAEHRIWFEVERETEQQGEQRVTTLVRAWLWATIPKRAGALPDAPGCRDAVAALQDAADVAAARAGLDPATDVEPFHWALYASRQIADADEVRLGVVVRTPPAGGDSDAARERTLARLKASLEEVGVYEGAFRGAAALHGGGE